MTGTLADRPAGVEKGAVLSADGAYRYLLTRRWDAGKTLPWVMLNPSTADACVDDPTIRRCMGFARSWGYAGITVGNLYALRATDPAALKSHPDPIGPDNDDYLHRLGWRCPLVMAGWGAHREATARARHLMGRMVLPPYSLRCLGTTSAGHPRHPLYVKSDTQSTPWGFR